MTFNVQFKTSQEFTPQFKEFQRISVIEDLETYDGVLSVTPSNEAQVLPTGQKFMLDDIIINPIPKEYGLVTYDQDKTITIT
jgi:hypothetical protein